MPSNGFQSTFRKYCGDGVKILHFKLRDIPVGIFAIRQLLDVNRNVYQLKRFQQGLNASKINITCFKFPTLFLIT